MNLIEFICSSNEARETRELSRLWTRFIEGFGLESYMMAEMSQRDTQDKEENLGIMASYPQAWLDHYLENHYVEFDPVYKRVSTYQGPFTWEEAVKETACPRDLKVMKEASEIGLSSGIGLCFRQPRGKMIGIGMASSQKTICKGRNDLSLLVAGSTQFYAAWSALVFPKPPGNVSLTRREREILLWIASGKTKPEVADILMISESSVKRHCENVFRKLDVYSLTSAVVEAIRLGFISPF